MEQSARYVNKDCNSQNENLPKDSKAETASIPRKNKTKNFRRTIKTLQKYNSSRIQNK